MRVVNVAGCELDETMERGAFRFAAFQLSEVLGTSVIGATVYETEAGDKLWPYHYHHGVEEWMYVVSGAPTLRDTGGERTLEPGTLATFQSGPAGAHTVEGPGRVVIFSAGAHGWGEAFVTHYPDSDKVAAAPGVMFRRSDAVKSWTETPVIPAGERATGGQTPVVNLASVAVERPSGGTSLGGQTWAATLSELACGDATSPYQYEWCREEWALVLNGAPTLRHQQGECVLSPGDLVCFPAGPSGARQLLNRADVPARLVIFSSPVGRPMSAFHPDEGTVMIRIPSHEGFLFREEDQIEDYWDGEPGADATER